MVSQIAAGIIDFFFCFFWSYMVNVEVCFLSCKEFWGVNWQQNWKFRRLSILIFTIDKCSIFLIILAFAFASSWIFRGLFDLFDYYIYNHASVPASTASNLPLLGAAAALTFGVGYWWMASRWHSRLYPIVDLKKQTLVLEVFSFYMLQFLQFKFFRYVKNFGEFLGCIGLYIW